MARRHPGDDERGIAVAPTAQLIHGEARAVVALHGEFDIATDDLVDDVLARAGACGGGDVVVHLGDVRFMSGSTLAVIRRHQAQLAVGGRVLTLRAPSTSARLVLRLAGGDDRTEAPSATAPPRLRSVPTPAVPLAAVREAGGARPAAP